MAPLVVISAGNKASQNIKQALMESAAGLRQTGENFWSCPSFGMAEYAGSIVDIVPKHDADCYIFASTHRSESGSQSFSVHTPGNWGNADLGGKPRTLNFAHPFALAAAARKMAKLSAETLGWKFSLEVDHHGPSLETPVLFVEIGSGENEWTLPAAGRIAAEGVLAAVRERNSGEAAFVGFGGGHYAPKFTPMVLDGKCALGHIISGYALERDGVDEERIAQVMEKNAGKIECALVDWKGIKGEKRKELIETLDRMKIAWKKA